MSRLSTITLGPLITRLGVSSRVGSYPRPILEDGQDTGAVMSSCAKHPTAAVLRRARRVLAAYREDPTGDYWARSTRPG